MWVVSEDCRGDYFRVKQSMTTSWPWRWTHCLWNITDNSSSDPVSYPRRLETFTCVSVENTTCFCGFRYNKNEMLLYFHLPSCWIFMNLHCTPNNMLCLQFGCNFSFFLTIIMVKSKQDRQCTHNVTLRCVHKSLLPWRNFIIYFPCVHACGCLCMWACACMCVYVALLIQHSVHMHHIVTSFVAP
jgi:hypothetical protein